MDDTAHYGLTATYSPEDNKLRLYTAARLDAATYEQVKAAGFRWAPQQKLWVAPAWTPARADLLTALCGEIGDEDTSLVDRAEERAERFEEYAEHRTEDATAARAAVGAIADNIPLGQPILVGHHSERHARKDAERIENGMRKAVKMWETATYWTRRAAGAKAHAKYKERADVRARRIKGLEADHRKRTREVQAAERAITWWGWIDNPEKIKRKDGAPTTLHERARSVANLDPCHVSRTFPLAEYPRTPPASQYEGPMSLWSALGDTEAEAIITPHQAQAIALAAHAGTIAYCGRWLAHLDNRLAYERAMLEETGGTVGAKFDFAVGGRVCTGREWSTILRINRQGGVVVSVTTNAPYRRVKLVSYITDYEAPSAETTAKVKTALKLAPMCNYPGEGFRHMTQDDWKRTYVDYRGSQTIDATATAARHRIRTAFGSGCRSAGVFLTDATRINPPAASGAVEARPEIEPAHRAPATPRPTPPLDDNAEAFRGIKDALKAGVTVVTAPDLFPTPPDLARRMATLAHIMGGERVLEPSAGTGNLVRAVFNACTGADNCRVVAVEHNAGCVRILEEQRQRTLYANEQTFAIHAADFLTCNGDLGTFHAVLMNPPFSDGRDVSHIRHGFTFLRPGGRLVAICANGPRQSAVLRPWVIGLGGTWEELPDGTFKNAGTNVRTVLLSVRRPESATE